MGTPLGMSFIDVQSILGCVIGTYTSSWGFQHCSVLTNRVMRRPSKRGTGQRTGSTFFICMSTNLNRNICYGARQTIFFVMTRLENAKDALCQEFERFPYTRNDLLGNAGCARKIREVIISFIIAQQAYGTCLDETRSLMIDHGVTEEVFEDKIAPYIDAFYKAKELIDAGYCDKLKINK